MLDAFYCAGADIALCTRQENYLILHILVRSAKQEQDTKMSDEATHSLKTFTLHLIRDLQTPFSAWDQANETCIHHAAEHEHSFELPQVML
ncbi:hypothetical protein CPC08DRAFT_332880 [Agrocybe pediades]|nr:hypothetical protein CPC08DRAFT_332880 [Agrocybe pediades]